ncbi:MAG: hypothetical protein IK016_10010 [Lachnospiraceae bacterium]|nr:hypothetical protein [Lachnospiraceae bacterium]
MKTAKRRMSQLLSALLLCSTVFSFGRIEAQAAVTGAWNTNAEGLKGQYQYIKWNSAGYKTSGHTDYDQATIVDAQSAPGVYQGINNTTFALDAPIATIFIDESKVHRVATKQGSTDPNDPAYMKQTSPTVWENEVLKVEELWHSANNSQNLQKFLKIDYNKTSTDNGFLGTGDGGYNYLMFDQKAAVQADTVNNRGLLIQQDNVFDGGIVRYTFKGAAEQNNKKMDVVITYSNLHIVLQNDIDNGTANNPKYGDKYKELNRFLICSGNDVRTHANAGTTGNNQRYGIKVDAKVQVLDGTDVVDGVFYFKAADIDVSREGTSFINLHDATNNRNYSEQIQIKSDGIVAGESYKLFIPGGDADKEKDTNGKSNAQNPKDSTLPGYKSIIKTDDSNQEWYRLEPQKDNQKVKDEQNSIYSGFLAAIDNTKGANVTVWSSGAGKNDNGENVSVETYLLAGNAGGKTTGVWYNLKSSTDTIGAKEPDKGGNIYTTNWGNKNGTPFTLGEGEKRLGPTTLTVSGGKTVTYSMIPNAAEGYVLKSLTESDGTIIYNYEGKSDEVLPSGWSKERKEKPG